MQAHRIVNPVKLKSWAALDLLAQKLPGWVYRGQRSAGWRLTSKLERDAGGGSLTGLSEVEERTFAEFRAGHQEIAPEPRPDEDDAMSWFALMQHYGKSTRLVDFTESIAIAAYFALAHEPPASTPEDAAIWAVNPIILRKMVEGQLLLPGNQRVSFGSDWAGGGLFNFLYGRTRVTGLGAIAARAACTNARMRKQLGLFIYALNLERTLEENLYGVYSLPADEAHQHVHVGFWNGIAAPHIIPKLQKSPVVKIILPLQSQDEIIGVLTSSGITRARLFPDFDPAA